jgi:hypothetical protein
MKITNTLAALSLTLLLAGCGHAVRIAALPSGCTASNSITLQHGAGRLVLDSECIHVSPGDTVTLAIDPPPTQPDVVRTKFRGLGNRWLDRSNESSSLATIRVPVPRDESKSNREYKYEIHVRGVGVLDPRIVVQ